MRIIGRAVVIFIVFGLPVIARGQQLDGYALATALGRQGMQVGEVYRFEFPRTDLKISIHGISVSPLLAGDSWVAFGGTVSDAQSIGELALLPGEVAPVLASLRAGGFKITSLGSYFPLEKPQLTSLTFMGIGPVLKLAKGLHAALAASGTPLGPVPSPSAAPLSTPRWAAFIEKILGRNGTMDGGVMTVTVARIDSVTQGMMGIPPAMGVGETLRFENIGGGQVVAAGSLALTSNEMTGVLASLEAHHFTVASVGSRLTDENPRLYFLRFFASGPAKKIVKGLKAALGGIQIEPPGMER